MAVVTEPLDTLVAAYAALAVRVGATDDAAVISLTGNPNPLLMEGLSTDRLMKAVPRARFAEVMQVVATNQVDGIQAAGTVVPILRGDEFVLAQA